METLNKRSILKLSSVFLLVLFAASNSCRSQTEIQKHIQNDGEVIAPAIFPSNVDSIVVHIDNVNSNALGLQKQELGPALGISGIALFGNYFFVADNFHGNIKKIGIKQKKIESVSATIASPKKDVGSLIVFRDTLICLSLFQDKVFFLGPDLNLIGTVSFAKSLKEFKLLRGEIYFESTFDRSRLFDRRLHSIPNTSEAISPADRRVFFYDGSWRLSNRYGVFILPFECPSSKVLDCDNIVFTNDRIVYLDDRESGLYKFYVFDFGQP